MGALLALFCSTSIFAENIAFLAKEKDQILQAEGEITLRWAPCSTFKIALSLMGYNEGILQDEAHPEWPFKVEYEKYIKDVGFYVLDRWKQAHNPSLWIKNSCLWDSQLLTQKLGAEKFKDYVTKFNYGNKDVSGDPGQGNGLTACWLSSSLEISPEEQVAFIQQLLQGQLPITPQSAEMAKKILFVELLSDGWVLYGRSGSGYHLNADRSKQFNCRHGWFVGWVEKQGRRIVFATHVDRVMEADRASQWARAFTKEKLQEIVSKQN